MNSQAASQLRKAANIDIHVAARPAAIDLPLARTALVVVDMQNGYGSPGGYREIIGRNISGVEQVVDNTVRVIAAARAAGVTVVYLQNGWDAELKTTGGPDSPNWHKSNPLKLMRDRPELRGKILTHGSWDYDFVPAIEPQADELVVPKARYSGFCGTDLDGLLRARNIRHLIFTGIASNVCVEFHHPRSLPPRIFLCPGRRRDAAVRTAFPPRRRSLQRRNIFWLGDHDRQHLRRAQVRDLRCGLVRLEPVCF